MDCPSPDSGRGLLLLQEDRQRPARRGKPTGEAGLAVKELKCSYHKSETIIFTVIICSYYGNLRASLFWKKPRYMSHGPSPFDNASHGVERSLGNPVWEELRPKLEHGLNNCSRPLTPGFEEPTCCLPSTPPTKTENGRSAATPVSGSGFSGYPARFQSVMPCWLLHRLSTTWPTRAKLNPSPSLDFSTPFCSSPRWTDSEDHSCPGPRADPKSRSTLRFCSLLHRSIGVQHCGIYFWDPPRGLGGQLSSRL